MRFVLHTAQGAQDVEIHCERPDATVGDLVRALATMAPAGAVPPQGGLFVNDLWAGDELRLDEAGLHEGATVAVVERVAPAETTGSAPAALTILSGDHAGSVLELVPGAYLVGRDVLCPVRLDDLSVSREHAELHVDANGTVTVLNRSATAGTVIDGDPVTAPTVVGPHSVLTLGAVDLSVQRPRTDDRPQDLDPFRRLTATGTLSLNRPPRLAADAAPAPLTIPEPPTPEHKPPFNAISILAPAIMGVVMVAVTGNVTFGLFALLSPVMGLGAWWETRNRARKTQRRQAAEYKAAVEVFARQLDEARVAEIQRRREALPDLGEVLRRAELPSVRLWERRPAHDDFLVLNGGYGDLPFTPPLAPRHGPVPPDVAGHLAWDSVLHRVPVPVDLRDGGVVGIVGDRDDALAVARGLLLQAAVYHGPADLRISVLTVDPSAGPWEFAKWLPHCRDAGAGSGERSLLAAGKEQVGLLLDDLLLEHEARSDAQRHLGARPAHAEGEVHTLFVVDGHDLWAGRNSGARQVLRGAAGPCAGIVVAPTVDRLPSVCSTILHVRELNESGLVNARDGQTEIPLVAARLSPGAARQGAVALARFEDPELRVAGAGIASLVHLAPLLGLDAIDPHHVGRLWDATTGRHDLRAPIGVTEHGTFVLDFDRHGPHGLIGGTTGSGKSELLKTLVAAFAARYPPTELTFGLFDFKGGATFNDFAHLPHTVGMASDLDVHLCRRALHCLRAELLHREHVFDRAGVKDLVELTERRERGDSRALAVEPVPRLLVIIDEFAALAKELNDEIAALVDLTARGRSLGVHLLLATQKPSTAVNAEIRANTRLRVSLLVEDKQDSIDVIGIPDAADVSVKGRAYVRVGAGEIVPVQTALSTAVSNDAEVAAVQARPFIVGAPAGSAGPSRRVASAGSSDLARLVDAASTVFALSGVAPPRRPWPDPLPDVVAVDSLIPDHPAAAPPLGPTTIPFALADDPASQTRYPVGWSLDEGNLLVFGVVGSGATTTLATIGLQALASTAGPTTHLYVLDCGAGELSALGRLPHTGAVIGAGERERQIRLVRWLRAEVERRQGLAAAERLDQPRLLLLIDNFEAFRAALEDAGNFALFDQFVRVYADGPGCGIYVAATAGRMGAVPSMIASATPAKLALRLADGLDYSTFGLRRNQIPNFVPGRGVLPTGQVVQVAVPALVDGMPAPLDDAVRSFLVDGSVPKDDPVRIEALPTDLDVSAVVDASRLLPDRWVLAVGLSDAGATPAGLVLYENEHGLVAGPARSGRSTALLTVARAFRTAVPDGLVLGVALRRSPLRDNHLVARVAVDPLAVAAVLDEALVATGPTLVLIDDADAVEDGDGRIAQLLAAAPPNVHVVVAGRAETLRGQYGHWTQTVRRAKAGILLQPNLDFDGDLLGAQLPRRTHVAMTTGRGFLVCDGGVNLVQVAH